MALWVQASFEMLRAPKEEGTRLGLCVSKFPTGPHTTAYKRTAIVSRLHSPHTRCSTAIPHSPPINCRRMPKSHNIWDDIGIASLGVTGLTAKLPKWPAKCFGSLGQACGAKRTLGGLTTSPGPWGRLLVISDPPRTCREPRKKRATDRWEEKEMPANSNPMVITKVPAMRQGPSRYWTGGCGTANTRTHTPNTQLTGTSASYVGPSHCGPLAIRQPAWVTVRRTDL